MWYLVRSVYKLEINESFRGKRSVEDVSRGFVMPLSIWILGTNGSPDFPRTKKTMR